MELLLAPSLKLLLETILMSEWAVTESSIKILYLGQMIPTLTWLSLRIIPDPDRPSVPSKIAISES